MELRDTKESHQSEQPERPPLHQLTHHSDCVISKSQYLPYTLSQRQFLAVNVSSGKQCALHSLLGINVLFLSF